MTHFLDTFALLEILQGNPSYERFSRDGSTGLFNLLEFHLHASRLRSEAEADAVFATLRGSVLDIQDQDILAASRFKRANSRRGFSYSDALGYTMARHRGMPFVTGDLAFQDAEGVLFVPAGTRRRPRM